MVFSRLLVIHLLLCVRYDEKKNNNEIKRRVRVVVCCLWLTSLLQRELVYSVQSRTFFKVVFVRFARDSSSSLLSWSRKIIIISLLANQVFPQHLDPRAHYRDCLLHRWLCTYNKMLPIKLKRKSLSIPVLQSRPFVLNVIEKKNRLIIFIEYFSPCKSGSLSLSLTFSLTVYIYLRLSFILQSCKVYESL